jgi:hypothetical protein
VRFHNLARKKEWCERYKGRFVFLGKKIGHKLSHYEGKKLKVTMFRELVPTNHQTIGKIPNFLLPPLTSSKIWLSTPPLHDGQPTYFPNFEKIKIKQWLQSVLFSFGKNLSFYGLGFRV